MMATKFDTIPILRFLQQTQTQRRDASLQQLESKYNQLLNDLTKQKNELIKRIRSDYDQSINQIRHAIHIKTQITALSNDWKNKLFDDQNLSANNAHLTTQTHISSTDKSALHKKFTKFKVTDLEDATASFALPN
eukprot:1125917_1